ncbi:MAG: hypothetical protein ACFFDP_09670 [Promethearchaeota archaeon]
MIWIVSVFIGLLLLTMTQQSVNATVVNSTYYFSQSSEYSRQEDFGPAYQYVSTSQFRVTVYNVTKQGGDDVYEYTYQGLYYSSWTYHNYTIDFQENKVYFDLNTVDNNGNNRSESTAITVFPYIYSGPGQNLFVNPVWSTHTTDWNNAKEEVEDDPTVNQYLCSFTNAENGQFSFTIVVNTEGHVGIKNENANGTTTFTLGASYDLDGVLMNWRFSQRYQLANENHTSDWTTIISIMRTTGAGPAPNPIFTYLQTILITTGIACPIGVLIGLYITKRGWVRTSQ